MLSELYYRKRWQRGGLKAAHVLKVKGEVVIRPSRANDNNVTGRHLCYARGINRPSLKTFSASTTQLFNFSFTSGFLLALKKKK